MSSTPQRMERFHDSGWASSQSSVLVAERPSTMSMSLAVRPGPPTSTIEVHHCWVRHSPVRLNSVSSRPSASTVPTRSVSASSSASPYAMTASLTVCQSQPSSTAISFTVRPKSPTCLTTQRPARSVRVMRGGAMRVSMIVHDPAGHAGSGQCQRCLRHTSRDGRPKQGRSTSSTQGRSLTHARTPQARHHAGSRRASMCTTIGSFDWSSTARTLTSGKPTSSSHMRVALVSTGAPERWQL